ncbi:MAG: transcription termination factor NusA [Candidatus Andersenbacteria bacterium]
MADEQPTFGSAIDQIVAEKGISKEKVLETVEAALAAAYRKDYGERGQDVRAEFNETDGTARIFKVVTVVPDEELENPAAQMALTEAQKEDPEVAVGKEFVEEVTPTDPNYGRVAAQTAKQVIIQRIREAEREAVFEEYKEKEGEIISGIVQRIEGDTVFVDIGRTTGVLFPSEQVQGERYRVNQRIRVYVVKVDLSGRGPEIVLSRSHPGMLRRLFELEVPEIFAGSVEIKAIAREASQRSKIAVSAKEEGIDPVGACIGQRGTRIQTIIAELSGEKIDIIQWDDDSARFIANALSPARVIAVDVYEEEKRAIAHVEEHQLSLAIGKKGQNVRLAAKLSGWRIDILKAGEEPGTVEAGATPEETPAVATEPATETATTIETTEPSTSETPEAPAPKEPPKEEPTA